MRVALAIQSASGICPFSCSSGANTNSSLIDYPCELRPRRSPKPQPPTLDALPNRTDRHCRPVWLYVRPPRRATRCCRWTHGYARRPAAHAAFLSSLARVLSICRGINHVAQGARTVRDWSVTRSELYTEASPTRRLATANRPRVSIRGRPCKNIYFDHHAKFGCCFSYCERACRRSPKFWTHWGPAPWDEEVVEPLETCFSASFDPRLPPIMVTQSHGSVGYWLPISDP